jgi:hypothetical protein
MPGSSINSNSNNSLFPIKFLQTSFQPECCTSDKDESELGVYRERTFQPECCISDSKPTFRAGRAAFLCGVAARTMGALAGIPVFAGRAFESFSAVTPLPFLIPVIADRVCTPCSAFSAPFTLLFFLTPTIFCRVYVSCSAVV